MKTPEELKKYKKDWYEANKVNIKLKQKMYYENNKEDIINNAKEYSKNNQDKIKKNKKEYYNKNKEAFLKEFKIYRDTHKEEIKQWKKENKDKRNIYDKERILKYPLVKLKKRVSNFIYTALKNKGYKKKSRSHEILGCSYIEFKTYLESKFKSWMNWQNHGLYNGSEDYGWDIDHIKPLSSAKTEEDIIRLNHHTNLQPLCGKVNRDIKKDNLFFS